MKRPRWTGLLLGCLLWLAAPAAAGADGGTSTRQCASADGFVRVQSERAINPARCLAVAERVVRAYAFVAAVASWNRQDRLRAKPLRFRLLDGSMRGLGYAEGLDLMVVRDAYLDAPLSEGTLAHELMHIQDARQLGGRRLPSFLAEGRALTVGHAYRMALGQEKGDYDRRMAASAATFTAKDADRLLRDYEGSGWDNQAIGTALVEYMRTRWNGTGVPDVGARLSRMIERMGAGDGFDSAFRKEFGTPFGDLRKAYAKYLDDTAGDPRARLQGTIWEAVGAAASSERRGETSAAR
jgi:hypothetical protein